MPGLGTIAVKLLTALLANWPKGHKLNIVETGTIRDPEPEPGYETEERSTLAIAQFLGKDSPHHFYSIDLSVSHIGICRKVLEEAGLEKSVKLLRARGSDALECLHMTWDFVLLDSDSDHQVILDEYLKIESRMVHPGIVLIDDVYRRGPVNKGKLVIPEADRMRHKHWRIGQTEAIGFGQKAEEIIAAVAKELKTDD